MAFFSYFDAAGDATDPRERELSVSGFVAHETQWREFERRWPEALGPDVSEFHMKDFAHFKKEFKKFKNDESGRRKFLQDISAVIKDCTVKPFGATIDLDVYRWFNQRFHIAESIGNAYTLGALLCIGQVAQWREKNNIKEPVLFYIEKGDNEQPQLEKLIKNADWSHEFLRMPVILPKREIDSEGNVHYILPFQACDFLAYEHARALQHSKEGKIEMRKSGHLVAGYPNKWKQVSRHTLWNQVKRLGIPSRPGHVPNHAMPEGPLCFLGNTLPLPSGVGTFHN